jgi:very-long-chain enoyl-CoA reductase
LERQKIYIQELDVKAPKTLVPSNASPESIALASKEVYYVKDLGPQIAWKLVFILEYLGPLLIHPLLYFFHPYSLFGGPGRLVQKTPLQSLALVLACLHYFKRELETLFVHRFSHGFMPWTNLPKNCFHYWILGGLLVALPVYSPFYTPSLIHPAASSFSELFWILLWTFAQLSNLKTHLILRDLRRPGTKERKIPMGYGFKYVTCPNYFFEILGWTCYTVLTGSLWGEFLYIFDGSKNLTASRKIFG